MNYTELNKAIDDSGLSRKAIAKRLGMAQKTFTDRTHGASQFKVSEALDLAEILNLTKRQRDYIFFS